jgi:hypothetical protein
MEDRNKKYRKEQVKRTDAQLKWYREKGDRAHKIKAGNKQKENERRSKERDE